MVAEDQLAPRLTPPRDTALSPSSLPLPADESPSPPPGAAAYRVPVDVASAVVALRSPGAKVGGLSVLIQRCRLHCIRSTRGSCTNTPALLAVTMHSGRTSLGGCIHTGWQLGCISADAHIGWFSRWTTARRVAGLRSTWRCCGASHTCWWCSCCPAVVSRGALHTARLSEQVVQLLLASGCNATDPPARLEYATPLMLCAEGQMGQAAELLLLCLPPSQLEAAANVRSQAGTHEPFINSSVDSPLRSASPMSAVGRSVTDECVCRLLIPAFPRALFTPLGHSLARGRCPRLGLPSVLVSVSLVTTHSPATREQCLPFGVVGGRPPRLGLRAVGVRRGSGQGLPQARRVPRLLRHFRDTSETFPKVCRRLVECRADPSCRSRAGLSPQASPRHFPRHSRDTPALPDLSRTFPETSPGPLLDGSPGRLAAGHGGALGQRGDGGGDRAAGSEGHASLPLGPAQNSSPRRRSRS